MAVGLNGGWAATACARVRGATLLLFMQFLNDRTVCALSGLVSRVKISCPDTQSDLKEGDLRLRWGGGGMGGVGVELTGGRVGGVRFRNVGVRVDLG